MAYNPSQPRHPAGSASGGEWAPAHGASSSPEGVESESERARKARIADGERVRQLDEQYRVISTRMDEAREADYKMSRFDAASVERVQELHEHALKVAEELGVTVNSNALASAKVPAGQYPIPTDEDMGHVARAVEASAILRLAASIELLPLAVKEAIGSKELKFGQSHAGLKLTIKPYDESDKFEVNGEQMSRAGSAKGFGEALEIVMVAQPDRLTGGGEHAPYTVFTLPPQSTFAHELGHIAIDVAGNISRDRDASLAVARLEAGRDSDDIQTSRFVLGDVIHEYEGMAKDLNQAAMEAEAKGNKGLAALLDVQRVDMLHEAALAHETLYQLRRAGEGMSKAEKPVESWAKEYWNSMGDLTMAVKEEGGFTEYAEKWNQDPRYGKDGGVRDPVHRGVHETLAEVEEAYQMELIRGDLRSSDPVAEFARKMASESHKIEGIRLRSGSTPAERNYPKIAAAWRTYRKLLDKGTGVKSKRMRVGAETKAILKSQVHKTYKDWERELVRVRENRASLKATL